MLSRVADSMFWMNRYMERAEGLLRVLLTNYVLSLDKGPYGVHSWKPVLEIFGNLSEEELDKIQYSSADTLQYLLLNRSNHNSLRNIINKARENARGMQDHITKEVWEEVNLIYHTVNQPGLEKKLSGAEALPNLDRLLKLCLTYVGVIDTTMPRGMGWNFMNIGRLIERAVLTTDVTCKQFEQISFELEDHKDILYWRNLLLSLSGYELHMKNYQGSTTNTNVLHQAVFNHHFPRSVVYALSRTEKYLTEVLEENEPPKKQMIYREFGRIYSRVKFADESSIKQITLQRFLQDTKEDLLKFSHVLGQQFFSYA
nr:alpha-E domain-containing protein [uncultured Lacibacter sp.]